MKLNDLHKDGATGIQILRPPAGDVHIQMPIAQAAALLRTLRKVHRTYLIGSPTASSLREGLEAILQPYEVNQRLDPAFAGPAPAVEAILEPEEESFPIRPGFETRRDWDESRGQ